MKLAIQNRGKVWGGNEKWVTTLAKGLASRGHEVVVSCRQGPLQARLESIGVRTTRFRPRGSVDFLSGLSFAGWLGREKPDALLLTSWQPLTWSVFAARVAGIRRVVLRQGIVRDFPRSPSRATALRSVDAIIANSEEIREAWQRSAPAPTGDKVKVVMNGIEPAAMEPADARGRLRGEIGCGETTFVVGGAGHLFPRKGFDVLVRAFAGAAIADSRLVIVGDGDQLRPLQGLAAEMGIADRVHWLGHRDDGPAVIAGLDLFVLSSHNEGMANVMLEAMAAAVPVIASDVSGVRSAIGARSKRTAAGWIVSPQETSGFALAISELASRLRRGDDEVKKRVSEAQWRIENWFGVDRMIDECEAILFDA
ncbi:MAG TPA: glycosyltransferase [Gemmatimonadaceae bacterium]|nr:glycosyltransferase [Gemmatimonadaceae bacterium]